MAVPLGGGVSAGAGSDANKKIDVLLIKLDKRLAELEPTCESTTGNYWDGTNVVPLAEAINEILRVMYLPDFVPGDPLPYPPGLDPKTLPIDEWERRWEDAIEYLKFNGYVYDKRRKQWRRFLCA
jgi:hypothetical protein